MTPPPAPAIAPSFPEPKPVRTISLRPDGTPIPASAADAEPAPTSSAPAAAPPPPAKPAAKATAAGAEPSTPKIDLPTKLSAKSSARVVVAKTDTTAPADAPGEPVQLGATSKPDSPKSRPRSRRRKRRPSPRRRRRPSRLRRPPAAGRSSSPRPGPRRKQKAWSPSSTRNTPPRSAAQRSAFTRRPPRATRSIACACTGLSKADAAALCARVKGDGGQCFVTK